MTLEEYLHEVVADYQLGGRTWGQSYWITLKKHRPDLAERITSNPSNEERYLGAFFFDVITKWS